MKKIGFSNNYILIIVFVVLSLFAIGILNYRTISTEDKSIETKEASIETEEESIETEDQSIETEEESVETKEASIETEKNQIESEEQADISEEIQPINNSVIENKNEKSEPGIFSDSTMQIHFIDVGQGDCSLIICDDEAMIIDAGDNSKGTFVQKYLKDLGITRLKYVIGTHPDADHIGGLDVILYKFNCDNILMSEAPGDTKSYDDVISAIKNKGYKMKIVGQGDHFDLGRASFEILSPIIGYPYADDNNNSIILRLDYGNNSFLFTGDAEYQPQQVIYYDDDINAKADLVKVPHHGSNNGYMKAFYDEVSPKYAVISVGRENDYGHPHSDILKDFQNRGVKVFRTDEQGSIIATSDGNSITFSTAKENANITGALPSEDTTYVVNINSMKFHYPTCESVLDMKAKNRVDVSCSREELLEKYPDAVPCKRCKP